MQNAMYTFFDSSSLRLTSLGSVLFLQITTLRAPHFGHFLLSMNSCGSSSVIASSDSLEDILFLIVLFLDSLDDFSQCVDVVFPLRVSCFGFELEHRDPVVVPSPIEKGVERKHKACHGKELRRREFVNDLSNQVHFIH
jgi:hypothetical protein